MNVLMTVGVIPSSRFTVTEKLPVYDRDGAIVNVFPKIEIKLGYVDERVTKSPSGSEYDGNIYVDEVPAPFVTLVNVVLKEGG